MNNLKYTTVPSMFDENANDGVSTMNFDEIFARDYSCTDSNGESVADQLLAPVLSENTNTDSNRRVPPKTEKGRKKNTVASPTDSDFVDEFTGHDNGEALHEPIVNSDSGGNAKKGGMAKSVSARKRKMARPKLHKRAVVNKKCADMSWKKFIEEFYNNATRVQALGESKTDKGVLVTLQRIFTLYVCSTMKIEVLMPNIFSEYFLELIVNTEFWKYNKVVFNLSGTQQIDDDSKNDDKTLVVPMDTQTILMGNSEEITEVRRIFLENVIVPRIVNECIIKLLPIVDIEYV